MQSFTTIAELRQRCNDARAVGRTVGLVPTMGSFHEGHRSLMRVAHAAHDFVVVTIFVNPLQFGPNEDVAVYPRDPEGDRTIALAEGIDVLFAPTVAEMYPAQPRTKVHVSRLTEAMCGAARPTHFDGVTTVVAKLFSIVGPCHAYFGRKDAQQLAVVQQMTKDLNFPVTIVGCPIVRESDGLALSSRNAYLSVDERSAATVLSTALHAAARDTRNGERNAATLKQHIIDLVATEPLVALEYVDIRRTADLAPLDHLEGSVLIALAAQVGRARLIDNVVLTIDKEHTCVAS